jgi:hypothetical protein
VPDEKIEGIIEDACESLSSEEDERVCVAIQDDLRTSTFR